MKLCEGDEDTEGKGKEERIDRALFAEISFGNQHDAAALILFNMRGNPERFAIACA